MDEAGFIAALKAEKPSVASLAAYLVALNESPKEQTAAIQVASDSLTASEKCRCLVETLMAVSETKPRDRSWHNQCKSLLEKAWVEQRAWSDWLALCDFDKPRIKTTVCLQRILTLADLKTGALCYDKTWGFGVVKEVMNHESRVEIDFEDKPGHFMTLNYAAEALSILGDDHLLARRHNDPEAFQALISDDPAEIVRLYIHSFGPKPIGLIQEFLMPRIVPETDWKKFWAAARKNLKADARVIIPAKRSEPIVLLEKDMAYDEDWFTTLAANRNMKSILTLTLEMLNEDPEAVERCGNARPAIQERLAFVVLGAGLRQLDLLIRAVLLARRSGLHAADINAADSMETILRGPAMFLRVLSEIPARDISPLIRELHELDPEHCEQSLLTLLPEMSFSTINESIPLLVEWGKELDIPKSIEEGWKSWELEVDMLYWLSVNPKRLESWKLGTVYDLLSRILKMFERDYSGSRLRIRNQLRDSFRQPAWLEKIFELMDDRQRRTLAQMVKESTAWEALEQASVLGQMVKLRPELESVVAGLQETSHVENAGPKTSLRSYQAREAQLKKIINEDIPKNSEEIAVARSHGDLRENFEYKAAKDMQRILMQRRMDIQNQLRDVAHTDFRKMEEPVEVGMGSAVRLRYGDGSEQAYHILGEWDSDEELSIISCGSALALALEGASVGETLSIPGEHGEQTVAVEGLTALPEAVLAWSDGDREQIHEG